MTERRGTENARGSLYMVIGSLGYVANDGFVRRATEEGLDVYQVLFFRGLVMVVLFAVAGQVRGQRLAPEHMRAPLLGRVAAEMVASALFFGALVRLEFANAQTILLIVPLAVTLAAAVILGERVTTRQYVTIIIGLLGVLIVVRPATDGFSAWSLLALLSAAFLVVREFATRRTDDDVPALAIALVTAVGLSALTGIISIFTGWGALTAAAAGYVGLSSVALFVGYVFAIQTVRVGDLSVSAPFRYSALLGAVLVGYVMFDELPDAFTVTGSAIILLTGLYAIHLERQAAEVAPVG